MDDSPYNIDKVFDNSLKKDINITKSLTGNILKLSNNFGNNIAHKIYDFEETAIKESLISLGWTAPNENIDNSLTKEGHKDDKGKLRYSLLIEGMPNALKAVVEVLEHGAEKYGIHNWQKVDKGIDRYKDALYRHVTKGNLFSKDKDSTLLEIAHIACNALFLLELISKEDKNENI